MSINPEEEKLRQLLENRKLEPFIEHIRFPHYKNLSPNTCIEFTYPITALVGANGTNKSSVLRAIQGSPGFSNLGNYWFSTTIDPIVDQNEDANEERSCFIYGYWNQYEGKTVEVLKTRIHNAKDADYWEPSRPLIKYGMEEMPSLSEGVEPPAGRLKTRWNTLEKSISYFDFRADLSAFDKFFYHGELRNKQSTLKNKKDFIRSRSYHLKSAIKNKYTSYEHYGVERIVEKGKENRLLSPDEVSEISAILGRSYSEISIIRHTFYNCDAYTAIMKVEKLHYSEAFAGSGEFAVVRLVVGIMTAAEYSLILLDEPEVSLHPGAQDRLMIFLAKMVKLKKHQIVIATHSPAVIRCLPPDAIKVFVMGPGGKVIMPNQKAFPEEAFFYLGEPVPDKITVVVEDPLAKEIVLRAKRLVGEAISSIFDICYFAGGSQTIWGHYTPVFSAEGRTDILVLFDGDKRPDQDFPDPDSISVIQEGDIKQLILDITGIDISFKVDGGDSGANASQIIQYSKKFIGWARKYVSYLPGSGIPELFIWDNMLKDDIAIEIESKEANVKERFKLLAKRELGLSVHEQVSASEILFTQRKRLATISDDNSELIQLKERLLQSIKSHNK